MYVSSILYKTRVWNGIVTSFIPPFQLFIYNKGLLSSHFHYILISLLCGFLAFNFLISHKNSFWCSAVDYPRDIVSALYTPFYRWFIEVIVYLIVTLIANHTFSSTKPFSRAYFRISSRDLVLFLLTQRLHNNSIQRNIVRMRFCVPFNIWVFKGGFSGQNNPCWPQLSFYLYLLIFYLYSKLPITVW